MIAEMIICRDRIRQFLELRPAFLDQKISTGFLDFLYMACVSRSFIKQGLFALL